MGSYCKKILFVQFRCLTNLTLGAVILCLHPVIFVLIYHLKTIYNNVCQFITGFSVNIFSRSRQVTFDSSVTMLENILAQKYLFLIMSIFIVRKWFLRSGIMVVRSLYLSDIFSPLSVLASFLIYHEHISLQFIDMSSKLHLN